jgi:hypothetical protein
MTNEEGQRRDMIDTIPVPHVPISEAFNAMVASLLRYMTDHKGDSEIDIDVIRKFLAVHDASQSPYMLSTADLNAGEPGTIDARTNAILRASLLMVAAMVRGGHSPAYEDALEKLSKAVWEVCESIRPEPPRRDIPRKRKS